MKLTDEQIQSIMTKEIACKTMLVSLDDFDKVVETHKQDGWTLFNKVQVNDKIKVTFKK